MYQIRVFGNRLATLDLDVMEWRSEDKRLELHLNTAFSIARMRRGNLYDPDPARTAVEAAVRSFRGEIIAEPQASGVADEPGLVY